MCIHSRKGTFRHLTLNSDLWPWPMNVTQIVSRSTSMSHIKVKNHLVYKSSSRHSKRHTGTDRHTHLTDCFTWTTKVITNNWLSPTQIGNNFKNYHCPITCNIELIYNRTFKLHRTPSGMSVTAELLVGIKDRSNWICRPYRVGWWCWRLVF